MLIPFHKLLTLGVRVFARPLVNFTKGCHKAQKVEHLRLRNFFIYMGTKQNQLEKKINAVYAMNQSVPKKLSETEYIERGIEFSYEILFYSLLLSFAFYELTKMACSSMKDKEQFNITTDTIQEDIDELNKQNQGEVLQILNNECLQTLRLANELKSYI